ncbi:PapX protein [Escherichia coli]|nr:PapX protein [Escherichia coli]
MNNTDTLEKIIRHQKNKDPAYPFREHLLMQLCIRTNKRMQDNISEFLGAYGINHSAYMVLTTFIRSGEPLSVTFRDKPETSVYQN